MPQTKLTNLVNPQVMADMVSASLPQKLRFAPIAKIDTTLAGEAGNTITVPKFAYIGDAVDVAEGVAMGTTVLTASTTQATVKKAGKAIEITDEAVLSGYGDPVGEASKQLTMAIASKVDADCYTALQGASLIYNGSSAIIGYDAVVDAIDLLQEESDKPMSKIMFVHPKQVTQLRKDSDFKDINKYPMQTVMTGAIGMIAGAEVVPSKRVTDDGTSYLCPIVVYEQADPNTASNADGFSEDAPALTIYLKRDVMVESDRDILAGTTVVATNEHYTAVLSNDSKVVLAKFKKA